ncbi:DNA/RNA helicase domain-containing protein [Holzapfeliella floricola]|uniref:DNA/RNA helicase domain-containing protein n=1 Tax=Holzapfeliella floricola TaxID=679249 RepID=UPI0023428AB0|nr:DNA/RNA helicase domain-containing protein [Holzapfeliella floricola]
MIWLDGDAGTGKSVVLTELFKKIQYESRTQKNTCLYQTSNYLTVNHAEVIKVYKGIAGKEPHLYKKRCSKTNHFN